MEELYQELLQRENFLSQQEYVGENKIRLLELRAIIVRVQQMLLDSLNNQT